MFKNIFRRLVVSAILIISTFTPLLIQAAESTRFGITPTKGRSWFVLTLKPGEVITDSVELVNIEKTPQTVLVYTVDATTTPEGAFAPNSQDAPREDVATWVKLPFDKVTLAPKEIKTIDFTITVPPNASPGDHFGALIVQPTTPDSVKTENKGNVTSGTNIITRVGVRMYLTIPGERIEKFKMSEVTTDWIKDDLLIKFSLQNMGNVRIAPAITITITEAGSGKTLQVLDYPSNSFDLLPNKTIAPPLRWPNSRNNGPVDVTVDVKLNKQTDQKKIRVDTGSPLSVPKQVIKTYGNLGLFALIIIGLLILLTILFFLALVWKKLTKLQNSMQRRRPTRRRPPRNNFDNQPPNF